MRTLLVSIFLLAVFSAAAQEYKKEYNRGVDKFREGKYNEAISAFSKVAALRDQIADKYFVADVYIALSKCRQNLGNLNDALKEANNAVALKPRYATAYIQKAEILQDMKRLPEQVSALDSAIKYKTMEEKLWIDRSFAHEMMGEYEQGWKDVLKAEEINPGNHLVYRQKGSILSKMNKHREAITAYNRAIALNPLETQSLMNRGLSKAELRLYDSAQIDMNRAAEMDSTIRFVAYNNIAYFIKFTQEDYAGAIEYFNKAIELSPGMSYAYNNRGYAWYKMQKYKEALKDIRKSLEMDPKNAYAYRNLALVYIAQDKTNEACEALKKAQALFFTRDYGNEVDQLATQHCKQ